MSDNIGLPALDAHTVSELRNQHYNATIVERIDSNSDLARFRIRPDDPIPSYKAGQYVTLGLGMWEPRLEGTQCESIPEKKMRKVARRAYSISCSMLNDDGDLAPVDEIDYFEFYITLVREASPPENEPPVLTPRLFLLSAGDRIAVGKKITGHYVLGDVKPDETILMLGTGTGEAPHNAMAATLLRNGHKGRIVNATSVRYRADLGYVDEHQELMNRFPQYRYLPFTTRERENLDQSHPAYVGKQYLQDLFTTGKLSEAADDPLDPSLTHVFLCGNPAMIGYVPPGADPPDKPGMLPLLKEAGFKEGSDCTGAGCVRFEKYW